MSKLHIAVLMMVKNEHERLHVTLESIKNFADSLILYDTGSEDDTIEIASKFCDSHNITFRLKEGEFSNFCDSRNVSLDFADTFDDVDYLLLLDTNDELKGGDFLRDVAQKSIDDEDVTSFLLCQQWWSGVFDSYFNVRFIKSRKGWRYRGVVHEWITNINYDPNDVKNHSSEKVDLNEVTIYQDRTQDDDKSGKRFIRDKKLLMDEHVRDKDEARTVFYLAQTFQCLNELEDAFYYYKIRSKMINGFWEEVFEALLRTAKVSEDLGMPWSESMKWYMQAFEHTERAEPLFAIAKHYESIKNWKLSHMFVKQACELDYPHHCNLFVDHALYEYKRWSLLGIVSFYSGHTDDGKLGCINAINCKNDDLDKNNLKFYLASALNDTNNLTKNDFIKSQIQLLKDNHPKFSDKQLLSKAKNAWKHHRK